jgi:hypothetical protein
MVLQSVHKKIRGSKASSLYCVWTKSEERNGPGLVAVWIDREMRPFEAQFLPEGEDGTGHVVNTAGTEDEGDALSSRAGSEGAPD